jgi:hypothetical protein
MSEFSIKGWLSLDNSGVKQALRQSHNDVRKFKTDTEGFTAAIGGEIASTLVGWGAGLASLEGIRQVMVDIIKYGGELNDMSVSLGVDPEKLQANAYAFTQTGASLDDYFRANIRVNELKDKAISKDAEAIDTLRKFGLTVADVKGMSPDALFDKMASAIQGTKNESQQLAMAFDAFGKAGPRLLPAIKEGLNELRASAKDNGQIITEHQLKILDDAGDKIDALKTRVKVLGAEIMTSFAERGIGEIVRDALVSTSLFGHLDSITSQSENERTTRIDKQIKAFNAKKAEAEAAKNPQKFESEKDRQARLKKEHDAAEARAKRITKLREDITEKSRKIALDSMKPEERLAALKAEQSKYAKQVFTDEEKQLENKKKIIGLSEDIKRAQDEVDRDKKKIEGKKTDYDLTANQKAGDYVSDRIFDIQQQQLVTLRQIAVNTQPKLDVWHVNVE